MKFILFLLMSSMLFAQASQAHDVYVHGYSRSNGDYVEAYHRTSPDNTINNNYGTQGNVNPYTGASGSLPQNRSQVQGLYNAGNGLGQ